MGQTLGRYMLLERVGEGGRGVVYVAEQTEPVRRRVVLKVIKLGMDTKQVVARFEAERQAMAMMDQSDRGPTEMMTRRPTRTYCPCSPVGIDPTGRMSNPLRTPEDYELFIYSLADQFKSVRQSTIAVVRLGAFLGRVAGEIHFDHGFRLVVRERILFDRLPVVIDWYGYEVWHGEEKLFWYDPQPHPDDSALRISHPHHKHLPPDIKHNRIPAPQMSFSRPNLPILIEEIGRLVSG